MSGGIREQVNLDYTSPWWGHSQGSWHTVQPGKPETEWNTQHKEETKTNWRLINTNEMNEGRDCYWGKQVQGRFSDAFGMLHDPGRSNPGQSLWPLGCSCVVLSVFWVVILLESKHSTSTEVLSGRDQNCVKCISLLLVSFHPSPVFLPQSNNVPL